MASAERNYPPGEDLATEWILFAEAISLEREAATALNARGNMDPGMRRRYCVTRGETSCSVGQNRPPRFPDEIPERLARMVRVRNLAPYRQGKHCGRSGANRVGQHGRRIIAPGTEQQTVCKVLLVQNQAIFGLGASPILLLPNRLISGKPTAAIAREAGCGARYVRRLAQEQTTRLLIAELMRPYLPQLARCLALAVNAIERALSAQQDWLEDHFAQLAGVDRLRRYLEMAQGSLATSRPSPTPHRKRA
jgi:hypothetical protein